MEVFKGWAYTKPYNFTGIVEEPDGDKSWFLNGGLHRVDGPAVEYADGGKTWWLNGRNVTEEAHTKACLKLGELTTKEPKGEGNTMKVSIKTIKQSIFISASGVEAEITLSSVDKVFADKASALITKVLIDAGLISGSSTVKSFRELEIKDKGLV
jgi:hypothetical protein